MDEEPPFGFLNIRPSPGAEIIRTHGFAILSWRVEPMTKPFIGQVLPEKLYPL
jgi:hypothetical protein